MVAVLLLHASGAGIFAPLPTGFAAGFTTRPMGLESVPLQEAARGLAIALGAPECETVLARQGHGRTVHVVEERPVPGAHRPLGQGDALVTRERGRLLGIVSADCVPLLLLDPEGGWIAAVHAGWRGTAAGIVDATVDVLEGRGVATSRLLALFGPSVSRDRYEVGPEVVEALKKGLGGAEPAAPETARRGEGDRSFVDVAAYVRATLLARGVSADGITSSGLCTASRSDLFPSYRRDGPGTGRIVSGIARL